jgi:hypothetical protein
MFTSQSRKSSRPLLPPDLVDYTPYTYAEEVAEMGGFDTILSYE